MEAAAARVPEALVRQRAREAEFARKLAAAGGTKEAENRLLRENQAREEADRRARLAAYRAEQQAKRKIPTA